MKRMVYRSLADLVAVIHLAFILFVLLGALLLLRWPKVMWVHLPAAIWGVAIEFAGLFCPLTRVENWLLRKAGESGYDGGFMAHYIFALIYPAGLTRGMEVVLGVIVLALNVGLYVKVLR
jgi:hypothetical protein